MVWKTLDEEILIEYEPLQAVEPCCAFWSSQWLEDKDHLVLKTAAEPQFRVF